CAPGLCGAVGAGLGCLPVHLRGMAAAGPALAGPAPLAQKLAGAPELWPRAAAAVAFLAHLLALSRGPRHLAEPPSRLLPDCRGAQLAPGSGPRRSGVSQRAARPDLAGHRPGGGPVSA